MRKPGKACAGKEMDMTIVGEGQSATILAQQLLSLLSPLARRELRPLCNSADGASLSAISDGSLTEFERILRYLVEFDRARGRLYIASAQIRHFLGSAMGSESAVLQEEETSVVHLIRQALLADRVEDALAGFRRGGGVFFAHLHGVEAARRIINSFPEAVRHANEQLILADVIATVKSGDIAHAGHKLSVHFGPQSQGLETVMEPGAFSHDFICCRLVLATNGEERVTDDVLAAIFRTINELPARAPVRKGMLYNVALDVFFRRRRWATAEEMARKSKYHFNNVRAMLAAFYIDLYFALIAMARGQISQAEEHLRNARAGLQSSARPSHNDLRLLTGLEHICSYERGDSAAFTEFLLKDAEEQSLDDVWPSIAWPIINIGSLALAQNTTLSTARAYVDRWRAQQWQSHRFATSVTLADVEVQQMHARWHEADEIMRELTGRSGREQLEVMMPTLGEIVDTSEIAIAMRWCRSLMESDPTDKSLYAAIEALCTNPNLTVREQAIVTIWCAYAALKRGEWDRVRSCFAALFAISQSTPIVAVVREQRQILAQFWGSKAIVQRLSSSTRVAGFLRSVREMLEHPSGTLGTDHGLTRQEMRMAVLLAEHVPNKLIARRLGLSVPTVRFHLRNLYRKLGVSDRIQAVGVAIQRGIISE